MHIMKKSIFFLVTCLFFVSCSTRKKSAGSPFMKGFYAYYNTLFNSKDALETELRSRDKAHVDNFYAPYIQLLTYDEQPMGADLQGSDMFSDDNAPGAFNGPGVPGSPGAPGMATNNRIAGSGASVLQISEAKALKAIANY